MSQLKTIVYLQDILHATDSLLKMPQQMSLLEFEDSEYAALAAERLFMIIGEALRVLRLRCLIASRI